MKTPPFLLLAALLFWGWQSGFFLAGAIMGVVLEGARFTGARWTIYWGGLAIFVCGVMIYFLTAYRGKDSEIRQ